MRDNGLFTYTTQAQVRKAFKEQFPNLDYRKIKDYGDGEMLKPEVRMRFRNFVDGLQYDGQISRELADRAVL